MRSKLLLRRISQIYLILVPFLTVAIGFGIGYSSNAIYVLIWLLHVCLMAVAIYKLGFSFSLPEKSKWLLLPVAGVIISLLALGLNLLPVSVLEPLATMGYLASVPAIPFLIPYLMGVGLLRLAGE